MRYSVAQLLKEPVGSFRDHQVNEEVLLDSGIKERVKGHLRLIRFNKGVWAKGELEASVDVLCSRCLNSFHQPIKTSIYEEFRPLVAEGEDRLLSEVGAEEGASAINEHHILDLMETVRQLLIVHRPLKPLCRANCGGICPTCGDDRNLSPCLCETRPANPQWAALVELLPGSGGRG